MDRAFILGFRQPANSQPVVFGLRLKPFSLGHVFLLESLGSPIFSGKDCPIEFADIASAVFACAHEHDEAQRNFRKWWFPLFVRAWGWFAKPNWLRDDVQAFWKYLSDGMSSPPIQPARQADGKVCQTPGPWLKLFFAMHILNMTEADAMRMPVVQLNILYSTWSEWSGNGQLADSDGINELWERAGLVAQKGDRN